MAIEKLSQIGVKGYGTLNFKGETNNEPQKVEEKKDNEKIKASNLMIGATALATAILGGLGLYHHYNSKAAKKAVQEGAEIITEKAETVVDTISEKADEVLDTITEKVSSKANDTVEIITEDFVQRAGEPVEELVEEITSEVTETVQPKIIEQKTEELSEEAIAKGKEIYAKIDKELHTPTKLDSEQIDKNLAPKAKPNSWDSAEMSAYYIDLEKATEKLSQIKNSLTTINEGGKQEVLSLFERVKKGEDISTEELEKMAEDFVARMKQQAEKSNQDLSQIKNEKIIRDIVEIRETFERRTEKLATSIRKGLPALIEARKNGITKTPEIIGNFEELLNKAEALNITGNKAEVINILKELRKQDIVKMAVDYEHYLAGFDERNILTGHDMHDFTLLNLDKYSEHWHKANNLVERFKNLAKSDDMYLEALTKKKSVTKVVQEETNPTLIQIQAAEDAMDVSKNVLKNTGETEEPLNELLKGQNKEYEDEMRRIIEGQTDNINQRIQNNFDEAIIPDDGIRLNNTDDMFPSDNGFDFHNTTDDMFPSDNGFDVHNTADDMFPVDDGINIDPTDTDFVDF